MSADRREFFRYPKTTGTNSGTLRIDDRDLAVEIVDESTVAWAICCRERPEVEERQVVLLQVDGSWSEGTVYRIRREETETRLVINRVRDLEEPESAEEIRARWWNLLFPRSPGAAGGMVLAGGLLIFLVVGAVLLATQSPGKWFRDLQRWGQSLVASQGKRLPKSPLPSGKISQAAADVAEVVGSAPQISGNFSQAGRGARISLQVIEDLQLTNAQLLSIERVSRETRAALWQLKQKTLADDELSKAESTVIADARRRIVELLDPQQRKKWQEFAE